MRAHLGRLIALILLAVALPAAAAEPTFPKFSGLVVDAANIIPPAEEAALTAKLEALQKQGKNQLVVATVPDLGGYEIADYGYRLGREWGVGLKEADNGAILIIAPNERKVRIEVGYGLEPILTDAFTSIIINQQILPRFKAGDMVGGIVAGVDALADPLSLPDDQAKAKIDGAIKEFDRTHKRSASGSGGGAGIIPFVFFAMLIGFVALSFLRGRGRKGPWGKRARSYGGSDWPIILWTIGSEVLRHSSRGGGGDGWGGGGGGGSDGGWGGGGFTGGGGGGFGGGGSSGSW